jgi:hypothetical protein
MQVFAAGELVDVINSEPYVGYFPAQTQSFYNAVKAYVVVVSDTFSGYFVNSHATYSALFGKYEFTAIDYGTGTASAIPVAQYATNLGDSVLEVTDLHTSEFTRIDKGSPFKAHTDVADGDTTPSVDSGRTLLVTGNTSPTTITEFEDSVPGQMVTIVFRDNNTTVAQESGGGTIRLSGPAGDRTFLDRQTLTLIRSDSFWYEVSATFSISSYAGLNFPEVASQSSADLTIAVAGTVLGDCLALGMPVGSQDATVVYTAWVSSAGTVTVRCSNFGTVARNPGYGVFNVAVVR